MASVLITYRLPKAAVSLLRAAGHTVTMREQETLISPDELRHAVQTYDGIIALLTDHFSAEMIAAAGPQLKVIANYAVGYDNIDVPAAMAKGIHITNTPDALTGAVAEHALALMLAISRRIVESDTFVRTGQYIGWRPLLLLGTELTDKTLGIIGLGRIGSGVAQRATLGLGMHVIYHDLKPDRQFEKEYSAVYYPKIEELLAKADVVSLHVPLVPQTRHLINAARLAHMKPTAFLINTARGPIIDERALLDVLRQKKIAGAALDVFENEPELTPGLTELSNVVLTPHTASATAETRTAMAEHAAKNIIAVLAGQAPLSPVKV